MDDTKKLIEKSDHKNGKRFKRKLSEEVSYEELVKGWSQCCFLLPKKRRLCNITRSNGSLYCGNHRPKDEVPEEKKELLERIPCPVDPSHTIYRSNLEKHVVKCNKAAEIKRTQEKSYYCLDCNSGKDAPWVDSVSLDFDDFTRIDVDLLAEKVKNCFDTDVVIDNYDPSVLNVEDDEVSKKVYEELSTGNTTFHSVKHLQQNLEIIKVMRTFNILSNNIPEEKSEKGRKYSTTFIELGAGKGLLTRAVKSAKDHLTHETTTEEKYSPSDVFIMLERNATRKKVDRFLRSNKIEENDNTARKNETLFHRVRIDMRHCFLPNLPGITQEEHSKDSALSISEGPFPKKRVVMMGKHFCGVASDLAINSLQSLITLNESNSLNKESLELALVLAACCHHAILPLDFSGWQWLSTRGFSPRELLLLRRWSGWAPLLLTKSSRLPEMDKSVDPTAVDEKNNDFDGKKDSSEVEVNEDIHFDETLLKEGGRVPRPSNISSEEMSLLGAKVKRVLDFSRVQYLKQLGFDAKLLRYCDPALSPECFMILAKNY